MSAPAVGASWISPYTWLAQPRGQRRLAQVHRSAHQDDFVAFVCKFLRHWYSQARKAHLVMQNLNTHLRASFEEMLGAHTAAALPRNVDFHYAPKHASWLNMTEIEIDALQRRRLAR